MTTWTNWIERACHGEEPRKGVKRYSRKISPKVRIGSKVRGGRRFFVQEFSTIDIFGSGAISEPRFQIYELDSVYARRPKRRIIAWRERLYRREFKTEKAAWDFVETFRE